MVIPGGNQMPVNLPKPIAAYFAAEKGNDSGAFARCFVGGAVVRDEGRTFEGLDAIQEWRAETREKYQPTFEPLASLQREDKTVVTTRVARKFPRQSHRASVRLRP
jgi:hypothetical protein